MKKIISILISFALFFTSFQVVFAGTTGSMSNFKKSKTYISGQFSDVSKDDWFAENVKKAYELELINGTGESTFSPDADLTYAEAITLASKIHNIFFKNDYDFARTTPWYQTYFDYYKTYIHGFEYEGQTVVPFVGQQHEKSIPRGHFVMYLYWALPDSEFKAINNILPGTLPDVMEFEDYQAIYAFYNAGILSGSDEYGTFHQFDPIKRSEAAAIITRVVDKSLRKKFKLPSTLDKLQGTWSLIKQNTWNEKENKYNQTRTEIVIEGKQISKYQIYESNNISSEFSKGTFTLSEKEKKLTASSRIYSKNTNGFCGVYDIEEFFDIAEISNNKLVLKHELAGTTFTSEYIKGEIDGHKEKCISDVKELLSLKPNDFYVNEKNISVVRTMTSICKAKCTTSIKKEDFLKVDAGDKGYVPGCMQYQYDYDADEAFGMFIPNMDAYEDYFIPYIEYLNNNPYAIKLSVKVEGMEALGESAKDLGGFNDITYEYYVGGQKMLVSWHNFKYSCGNSIWITFVQY